MMIIQFWLSIYYMCTSKKKYRYCNRTFISDRRGVKQFVKQKFRYE